MYLVPLQVFVISSKKIQQRGYDTLFKHTTRSRNSLFGAIVLRFPQKLQVGLGPWRHLHWMACLTHPAAAPGIILTETSCTEQATPAVQSPPPACPGFYPPSVPCCSRLCICVCTSA
jgi:hypothetical protein